MEHNTAVYRVTQKSASVTSYPGNEIRMSHNTSDEEPVVCDFWVSWNLRKIW